MLNFNTVLTHKTVKENFAKKSLTEKPHIHDDINSKSQATVKAIKEANIKAMRQILKL